jgi:GntR family transcriptional regulator
MPMNKPRPLYQKVREQVVKSLADGEWLPGAMLPSEPKLAERFDVGISTIRAALRELEKAHVLIRAQGRGTFVAQFDQLEGIHRFLNIARNDGGHESPSRRLLAFERTTAPPFIAELLHLPRTGDGEKIFKLSTLVSLDDVPVYYSNVFLPARHFRGLKRANLPDGNRSLYSLYQELFNINVTHVVDSITATPAPAIVAKLCNMQTGECSLCLTRVSYTYNGAPVEVRRNWVNIANHCYRIEQGETV